MKTATMLLAAWTWVIPPVVGTVGQGWDAVSTYRGTHGMTRVPCVETNSLYGNPRPGVGTLVALKASTVAPMWIVAVMARRYPGSKTLRVINWVTGSGVATAGVIPAIHNVANCGW